MTIEEFNRQLSKLLTELFSGLNVGSVPIRMTFELYEENADLQAPLRLDLSVRRVWRD